MGFNFRHQINIIFYQEIKAPGAGNPALPDVPRFVVLFDMQGRVPEVLQQQQRLFVERLLDLFRRLGVASYEVRGLKDFHRAGRLFFLPDILADSLWSEFINSACVW